jgi:hypothetical protein
MGEQLSALVYDTLLDPFLSRFVLSLRRLRFLYTKRPVKDTQTSLAAPVYGTERHYSGACSSNLVMLRQDRKAENIYARSIRRTVGVRQ